VPGPADSDRATGGAELVSRDRETATLERLMRLGGEDFVRSLAAIFLQDMPERFEGARAALTSRDASSVARFAHAMKSSAAQLGADALANVCEAAEGAAERQDLAAGETFLVEAEGHYAAFSEWLVARTGAGARPSTRAISSAGPVIAVIEDNADNRLLVEAILADRFVLDEYPTGADALEGMVSRQPDLVLLGVSLPGMDGIEVLARMRHDRTLRTVPVIALTAHAMAGDRERYLTAGFDDYVAKPIVDENLLVHAIERLLARRSPGSSTGMPDNGRHLS